MTTRDVYPSPLDCQAAAILFDRINDPVLEIVLECQDLDPEREPAKTLPDLFKELNLQP